MASGFSTYLCLLSVVLSSIAHTTVLRRLQSSSSSMDNLLGQYLTSDSSDEQVPTASPTAAPSDNPSSSPTRNPSTDPSKSPSAPPSASPSQNPSASPSRSPSRTPSGSPSASPTTAAPTSQPTTATPTSPPTTASPTAPPSRACGSICSGCNDDAYSCNVWSHCKYVGEEGGADSYCTRDCGATCSDSVCEGSSTACEKDPNCDYFPGAGGCTEASPGPKRAMKVEGKRDSVHFDNKRVGNEHEHEQQILVSVAPGDLLNLWLMMLACLLPCFCWVCFVHGKRVSFQALIRR